MSHSSAPAHRQRRAAVPTIALAAWTIALPIMGCYSNVPVATGVTPTPGEGVVVLTTDGTSAVRQKLGDNIREIDGDILRVSRDSITIAVTQTTTLSRERFTQNGDVITIATPLVAQVQKRTYSRKRTFILIGTVIAVLAATLGISSAASASSGGDGGGGIQP
ncbi:hypothetical protein [Gemmatimonas phototrophica]|uniref:Uncharacterized protein n=1 Tax=Gemmatimonas phototrophica TaxID=1379270 RepID=A0A143BGL8_9BACT|nr:hypothetical protein [Gemmatimonas phototrophica]AMW04188.1 hypothetical protein GEMMAAP_03725 [Gemmatimonas phototrophica]